MYHAKLIKFETSILIFKINLKSKLNFKINIMMSVNTQLKFQFDIINLIIIAKKLID